jgi:hypothetical protein
MSLETGLDGQSYIVYERTISHFVYISRIFSYPFGGALIIGNG